MVMAYGLVNQTNYSLFEDFLKSVGQSVGQICPTTKKALTFSCKCLIFLGVPKGI